MKKILLVSFTGVLLILGFLGFTYLKQNEKSGGAQNNLSSNNLQNQNAQPDTQGNAQIIKVGGYVFPPYVEETEPNVYSGITFDVINAMNAFQSKYKFQFVPTSPNRRYEDFEAKKYDMILFEETTWGWQDMKDVVASNVFLKDGEVYITKADPSKTQSYFDSFTGKSIAIYLGYHYGFADFNADESVLRTKYNTQISTSHEGNIKKVIAGRVDLAVVTNSFLQRFLKQNPDLRSQLLISKKYDQMYDLTVLLNKNQSLQVGVVNQMLADMEKAGVLAKIWNKYGIE